MPLNAKGQRILAQMVEQYGEKKGREVFYASVDSGKITGVEDPYDTPHKAGAARLRMRKARANR